MITRAVAAATAILIATGWASPARAAIDIQGLTSADKREVMRTYPSLAGPNKPQLAELDEVIRHLVITGSYSSVRIETDNAGKYSLLATQLRRIQDIKISGNTTFDRDEVLGAIGLKAGAKFDRSKVLEIEDRVKEFYGRHGYFNTLVSIGFEELPNQDMTLLVRVREREPCLIEKIEFTAETPNPALNERLARNVRRLLDKPFTEQNITTIEASLQEFLKKNRYLNTILQQKDARYNTSKTRVTLTYDLTDTFTYEVLLSGYKQYSINELLRNLNLDEFVRGTADPAQEIAQKVKDYYVSTGFSQVKVTFEERQLKEQFIKRVLVDIQEGPRVKIANLEVVGRISRPSHYYADFILDNSSDAVNDGYYVRSDLENGYKNLVTELNNQGFLKAKVQSSRVDYQQERERTQAVVTTVMDEGPLTQLEKINLLGVKAFDPRDLLKALNIKTNAPLRLNELEAGIENLKKFYFNRGYIEMKIANEDDSLVEYDEKGLQASLNFKIVEGPQVFVKSMYVEGNTFTKDYVVLREVDIAIGDLLTPEVLDEAQKRLDKLAIFSRVEIRTLEANTSISQRTLVISVVERNPGLFKLGAGITNKREFTVRGFSGLSYNNIGGTARAVSLRGTIEQSIVKSSFLEYEASLGYLEPFLFDSTVRGRASYSRSEKIIEIPRELLQATDSINLTLEKDITSKIKFSWLAWGFDSVETFNSPDASVEPGKKQDRQEIAYVGPSIDVDYRDNPFLPTTGIYTKVDAEYASPDIGSSRNIEFVRTQGTISHYIPLRPRWVWANSFRTGYEKNLNTNAGSGVPASFGFFLGGYNTVRGYLGDANDRIPNNKEFYQDPNKATTQLIIPKESTYYLVKSEVRFPLWSDTYGGVLFYDAGLVQIQNVFSPDNVRYEGNWRQSYGIGFRVNTPVGPLSLDYARKVHLQYKGESPDQLHLSIGTF